MRLKLVQLSTSTQVLDEHGRYIATYPTRAEARAFVDGYSRAAGAVDDSRLRRAITDARRVLAEVDA